MGTYLLWVALIIGATGLLLKYVFAPIYNKHSLLKDDPQFHLHISWKEFAVVLGIATLVLGPVVGFIGSKVAVDSKLDREQFLNGIELTAVKTPTKCYGGQSGNSASDGESNCEQTYVSDTYTYQELTTCTRINSKGETESYSCWETRWADVHTPFATIENHYSITHSFGSATIATSVLDANPVQYSKNKAIPADLPRGDPPFWADAKKNIDAGTPRGVTVMEDYDNFIIASDNDLLKTYSADIASYKAKKQLPLHTRKLLDDPIHTYYQADKLSFVGPSGEYTPPNDKEWQTSLTRFNAALGMSKRGDLHAVVIDADLIDSPQDYVTALKAYWMSPELGKRQIAKNGIVLVMGVKNGKVAWAKATTGMPMGNETMLNALELRLRDVPFTPDAVFGTPATTMNGDEVNVTLGDSPGVVAQTVFTDFPFKRACMRCEDKDEAGSSNYVFLEAEVKPSTKAYVIMAIVVFIASMAMWYFVAITPDTAARKEFDAEAEWRSTELRRQFGHRESEIDAWYPTPYDTPKSRITKRKRDSR